MIVCRKCSRRHPDDTEFCDCGAYLPFDGERVADAPSAAPPPRGPAAPDLPPPPSPSSPPASSAWQAVEPTTREAPRRPAGEPAPWGGLPGESTWAGAGGADDRGPTSTVDARLPDAPTRETAAAPVWIEPTGRAGDVPCSRCGSMNNPDRQFCQHCGQALAGGATAAVDFGASSGKVPWWRRFGRSARARGAKLDGTNLAMDARRLAAPGGLSSRVMMFRAGGIALVAVALLAFLGPWKGTVVRGARTLLGGKQYEAIVSADIRADSLATSPDIPIQPIPQEVPDNVLDRHANTAWATRWLAAVPPAAPVAPTDPAAAPTTTAAPVTTTPATVPSGPCSTEARTDSLLRFTFREPTDIGRIEILAGRYDADKARALYSRPRLVELTVGDRCERYELLDKGTLQALDFAADDVTQAELRIVDVYREDASAATVEISEVVFERER